MFGTGFATFLTGLILFGFGIGVILGMPLGFFMGFFLH
jgi:hypothetical protein